jgi:hypothetical protein
MEELIIRWPISILTRKKLINIGIGTVDQLLSADDVMVSRIECMSLKIRNEMIEYVRLFYKENDDKYNMFKNVLLGEQRSKLIENISKIESINSHNIEVPKSGMSENIIHFLTNVGINKDSNFFQLDCKTISLLKSMTVSQRDEILDYLEQLNIKREKTSDKLIITSKLNVGESGIIKRMPNWESNTINDNICEKNRIDESGNNTFEDIERRKGYVPVKKNNKNNSVYYDVIKTYFDFDISISSNFKIKDMKKIRNIIEMNFKEFVLPRDNKYLKREILQDKRLIKVKQGKYCPIDKLHFNKITFRDIDSFLSKSSKDLFDLENVFFTFKEQLISIYQIDNKFFFSSMMKYLYSDKYSILGNRIIKKNKLNRDMESELEQFLSSYNYPIPRKEIKKNISNINDLIISGIVRRSDKMIIWDEVSIIHLTNIVTTKEDYQYISEILLTSIYNNHGYTNDQIIFEVLQDVFGEYLVKNNIGSPENLFHIISNLYGNVFRFYKPHIVTLDFPVINLNSDNLVDYFNIIGDVKLLERFEQTLKTRLNTE